jgi:hypothetical protein
MTVDHILPVSLGGGNMQSNYQPMCNFCNGKKGNMISRADVERIVDHISDHVGPHLNNVTKFLQFLAVEHPDLHNLLINEIYTHAAGTGASENIMRATKHFINV